MPSAPIPALNFRRRKQGFSKRLEHDLEIKRIQAAWKEYFETQKQLIDWEEKAKSSSNSKPHRAAKVFTTLGNKL